VVKVIMKHERHRLFRNKKGFNDIYVLVVIGSILFFSAIAIPLIGQSFGTSTASFDTENLADSVQQDAENVSSFNAFDVLFTFLKLAFFDFGDSLSLPFWLDAVYTMLAIVFIVTIARNIWIGGGG